MIAGNSMLPTRTWTRRRRAVECFGARREAASTVTVDHLGGACADTSDARDVQCRVVDAVGSGGGACGVNWRNTNGERIINSRFPSDVVISLSSNCPMQV